MHARVQCSCQLHIMFHRPNIFEHNTDCVILFFFWCFVCYNNSLLSLVPSLASQGVACETSLVSTIDNREEYFSLLSTVMSPLTPDPPRHAEGLGTRLLTRMNLTCQSMKTRLVTRTNSRSTFTVGIYTFRSHHVPDPRAQCVHYKL